MKTDELSRNGFGGSLPVENVQSLATKNLKDIPSRYIREEVEFDIVSIDESFRIPVIDMSKLGHDDEQQKLHLACKNWGFFQLINHGVGDEVIEKMKMDIQEFFKLPLHEKLACAQIPNDIEGYGQAFVVSEDQKLDWGDMLFLLPLPVPLRNMRLWPTTPPSFR
ncbi:S-norcoclaurine synthase 1 [Hibiscus syriacus]|uniref:S-norcoclaurine synthase 1 n=2 Tax=Hibiscus syriacus TaxID=106335 RepID=A0A6A2XPV6_HIBSY|nr:S-norcoclaurine synthase 1 [Hibiscus syriacus]